MCALCEFTGLKLDRKVTLKNSFPHYSLSKIYVQKKKQHGVEELSESCDSQYIWYVFH